MLIWDQMEYICPEYLLCLDSVRVDSIKIWWKINLFDMKSLFVLLTFIYTLLIVILLIECIVKIIRNYIIAGKNLIVLS